MAGNTLNDLAANVRQLPRRIVEGAAERFEVVAIQAAARAGARTMTIRGRTAPLTTVSNVTGGGTGATAEVHGTPARAWAWLEDGTKRHVEGGRGILLAGPRLNHPVYGPVVHPGTRGRQVWTGAALAFEREAGQLADDLVEEAISRG